ncbi:hypothetical protein BH11ACT7_BH11ACT7_31220 [soil metagenome]
MKMLRPQEHHADLGLVDDDNTEDLRTKNAPGRCANTAEGDSNQPLTRKAVQ